MTDDGLAAAINHAQYQWFLSREGHGTLRDFMEPELRQWLWETHGIGEPAVRQDERLFPLPGGPR